jgi:CheY-like chemotaxis protein
MKTAAFGGVAWKTAGRKPRKPSHHQVHVAIMPTADTGWRSAARGKGSGFPDAYPALLGLEILLVEDEGLVAAMLEDMLADFGCILAGTAATVGEALAAVEAATEIDAAILDVNLGGEKVFPVADILVGRDVPIVFSTAYGPADIAERYPQARIIHKPYRPEDLAALLIGIADKPPH